jgi:hypothetical protein
MILYQLLCRNQHGFEAWFRDSKAYDAQAKAGRVTCPVCGSHKVAKAPMAPNIATRRETPAAEPARAPKETAKAEIADAIELLKALRRQVEATCDYVGDQFAEEARKIHYGETERRDIYGDATAEEAEELREEGVEFTRIPWLPRHDS